MLKEKKRVHLAHLFRKAVHSCEKLNLVFFRNQWSSEAGSPHMTNSLPQAKTLSYTVDTAEYSFNNSNLKQSLKGVHRLCF